MFKIQTLKHATPLLFDNTLSNRQRRCRYRITQYHTRPTTSVTTSSVFDHFSELDLIIRGFFGESRPLDLVRSFFREIRRIQPVLLIPVHRTSTLLSDLCFLRASWLGSSGTFSVSLLNIFLHAYQILGVTYRNTLFGHQQQLKG